MCLQAFKVKFVTSYTERLLRLADNTTLRSELAQFPLAVDADDAILPEHRAGMCELPQFALLWRMPDCI